jgi:hypothetical protein
MVMGMRNWQTVTIDQKEWRKIMLEAKVYNRLQCWRRRRRKKVKKLEFTLATP